MKIKKLETYTHGPLSFVKVTAEDGAEGWGQMAPHNADIAAQVFHRQVAPEVLGKAGDRIDALVDRVVESQYKFFGSYLCRALGGLDTALWDLEAKRAGKCVCDMLGGTLRSVQVYGSSMRRDIKPADEAERMKRLRDEQGYRAFKTRVGARTGHDLDQWSGRTEELIPLLRKELGDDIRLMVDANGAYTPLRAIEVGRLLEKHGVAHYEEPCPYWEIEWTAEVATALDVAVAGGEQDYNMAQWRRIVNLPAVDIVQPDICYVGGLTNALRVSNLAAGRGRICVPHCANHSLLSVFTVHFLNAINNPGPFMEHSIEETDWTKDLFQPELRIQNGQLSVPEAPGWGVEINKAWLEKAERRVTEAD